jgi:hypothetical protein
MAATRIYADFNGLVQGLRDPHRTAVVLDTLGTLRDLSNAGIVLREGLPLIAVDASDDEEDLEGHGTTHYDAVRKWWLLEFDAQGVRYVPAGDRTPVDIFRCVHCAALFSDYILQGQLGPAVVCSSCRTSVLAALAPPTEP